MLDEQVQKDPKVTVRRNATQAGITYPGGSYFAFKKAQDRDIVKGFSMGENSIHE